MTKVEDFVVMLPEHCKWCGSAVRWCTNPNPDLTRHSCNRAFAAGAAEGRELLKRTCSVCGFVAPPDPSTALHPSNHGCPVWERAWSGGAAQERLSWQTEIWTALPDHHAEANPPGTLTLKDVAGLVRAIAVQERERIMDLLRPEYPDAIRAIHERSIRARAEAPTGPMAQDMREALRAEPKCATCDGLGFRADPNAECLSAPCPDCGPSPEPKCATCGGTREVGDVTDSGRRFRRPCPDCTPREVEREQLPRRT